MPEQDEKQKKKLGRNIRPAHSGGKIPETISGKPAVRIELYYDTLAALHQQVGQVVVAGLRAQSSAKPAIQRQKKSP